jgi:hypothetical protein
VPVVRAVAGGLGVLLLAASAIAIVFAAPLPVILGPAIAGLVLTVGALFERVSYKKIAATPPGRGWVATGERFVDPASGRLVEVHFRPETGERSYVDGGTAPPD